MTFNNDQWWIEVKDYNLQFACTFFLPHEGLTVGFKFRFALWGLTKIILLRQPSKRPLQWLWVQKYGQLHVFLFPHHVETIGYSHPSTYCPKSKSRSTKRLEGLQTHTTSFKVKPASKSPFAEFLDISLQASELRSWIFPWLIRWLRSAWNISNFFMLWR